MMLLPSRIAVASDPQEARAGRFRVLLATLVAMSAGCSAAVGSTDAGTDATRPDNDVVDESLGRDGGSDTGGGDSGVHCGTTGSNVFPTFDRTCTRAEDCVVAPHQTDCCGSIAATGIRRDEQARFQAAEAACEAMYPPCGCASGTVTTDDGMSSRGSGLSAVQVECRAGQCTTTTRAAQPCGGAMCTPSQICVPGCCGVAGCTPPPPRCVDVPDSCGGAPSCGCFPSNPCPTGTCVRFENGAPLCQCA